MTDRAISDALGFVLVFGIIISTIAIVYLGGFQSLDDARQYERMNNAERAFEVFHDNVEDITQRGAPSRATEIKLAEASLESRARRTVEVNVTRNGDPTKGDNSSREYRPIVYESRTDTSNELTYALGATLRQSTGGTVMMEEPNWVITEDRVSLQLVKTTHEDGRNVTGSGTMLIRTERESTRVLYANTSHSSDVTITITSPEADAWERYFEDENDAISCSRPSADTVDCEITDVETVYVSVVEIGFWFE